MTAVSNYSSNNSYAIDLNRDGKHAVSALDANAMDELHERLKKDKNAQTAVVQNVLARAGDNGAVIANANRDGGGNTGGATTSTGTSGSQSTMSAVTSTLSSRGMSITSTGLQSSDGFTSEHVNARAALDFSGAPQLPESTRATHLTSSTAAATATLATSGTSHVSSTSAAIAKDTANIVSVGSGHLSRSTSAVTGLSGSTSSPHGQVALQGSDLLSRLSDYQSRNADGDGGLMWYALSQMAKGASQDEKDAADIKNAMQMGKVQEKKNEIKTTEEQIQKEREAAAMNLMFAIIGAVVQMVLGATGNPAAAAIGNALGPLIKSMGEYINKMSGPQSEADQKKIEIMRHQLMQEVYEQGAENAKSNYDEARELLKLAIKILSEHAERQTQISTTITRS
jgi:hypothetical protein